MKLNLKIFAPMIVLLAIGAFGTAPVLADEGTQVCTHTDTAGWRLETCTQWARTDTGSGGQITGYCTATARKLDPTDVISEEGETEIGVLGGTDVEGAGNVSREALASVAMGLQHCQVLVDTQAGGNAVGAVPGGATARTSSRINTSSGLNGTPEVCVRAVAMLEDASVIYHPSPTDIECNT